MGLVYVYHDVWDTVQCNTATMRRKSGAIYTSKKLNILTPPRFELFITFSCSRFLQKGTNFFRECCRGSFYSSERRPPEPNRLMFVTLPIGPNTGPVPFLRRRKLMQTCVPILTMLFPLSPTTALA